MLGSDGKLSQALWCWYSDRGPWRSLVPWCRSARLVCSAPGHTLCRLCVLPVLA